MRAVVFGGSGFIGSHVADVLDDKGYEVLIYDIKRSPYLRPSQKMIVGNILNKNKVNKAIRNSDVVYNFAAIADIEEACREPLRTVESNIIGNTIILEACRNNNIKRFVFASSLYVFSKSGCLYRSSKQACELLVENYNELFGLPYTILRYGSLYGPRSDEKNFIYRTIKQALEKDRVTRHGRGEEIREYIHVRDAAIASVEALSGKFKNKYVNITGNESLKIKELLFMIKDILKNRPRIKFLPSKGSYHYEITPYSFVPRKGDKFRGKTRFNLDKGVRELIKIIKNEIRRPR